MLMDVLIVVHLVCKVDHKCRSSGRKFQQLPGEAELCWATALLFPSQLLK